MSYTSQYNFSIVPRIPFIFLLFKPVNPNLTYMTGGEMLRKYSNLFQKWKKRHISKYMFLGKDKNGLI